MKHDWTSMGDGPIRCLRCEALYSSAIDRMSPCRVSQNPASNDAAKRDIYDDDPRASMPCDTEPSDGR